MPDALVDKLLAAGVKHLKEFGYPDVTKRNITHDLVYREFFKTMLEGTKEDAAGNKQIVSACNLLIKEIDSNRK